MEVAAKLQIKPGTSVALVDLPPDVVIDLPEGSAATTRAAGADAVIVFASNSNELKRRAKPFVDAAKRDALAWIAYPKAGRLGTDLNRDLVAEMLSERDIRPVRQVAIDDVWSALRFRPA
jgi:hypothetical protein